MAEYTGWTIRVHASEDSMGDTSGADFEASMDAFTEAIEAALTESFAGAHVIVDRTQALSGATVSGPQGEEDDDLREAVEDMVGRIFGQGAFWVMAS